MEIRRVTIADLKTAAYNPRVKLKPSDTEYQEIARSLKEFTLVEPLVWNETTGNLVGGHQRLQVLTDLGETEIDVSVVHLSPEKEKALNLALNNIQGRWDQNKLVDIIAELEQQHLDLSVAGFDQQEVEQFLRQHHALHAADFLTPLLATPVPAPAPLPSIGGASLPGLAPHPAQGYGLPASEPQEEHGTPAADTPQYFQLTFAFTYDQREIVQNALKLAKNYWGAHTSMDALVQICNEFVARVTVGQGG